MGDEWIVGGIVVAVVAIAVAAVALMTGELKFPASTNPYPFANPDQEFRAMQYVPDEAVLTNHETITWTDAQGRERQITVEREVR
jgi:hypothetical protein